MIGSDKVQGTKVFSSSGEEMGEIDRLMIEKTSGRVSYAVLRFGGVLGLGKDHYRVPWRALDYDMELGGYRTALPIEKLREAPSHAADGHWAWENPEKANAVEDSIAASDTHPERSESVPAKENARSCRAFEFQRSRPLKPL